MDANQVNQEKAAIQILAKAAEGYITGLSDELSKAFVTPQVQAALQIVGTILEARWPKETEESAPVVEAEPAAKKSKSGGMNRK